MTFERAGGPGRTASLFRPGSPAALALLRAAWPLAVGPELARRTALQAVEGSTLRVRVPDARWRKVLHRMQGDILSRLRSIAGDLAPRRLGFVDGLVDPPAPETAGAHLESATPAAAVEPCCPPSVAAEADAIRDPELRSRFMQSAARYLARP